MAFNPYLPSDNQRSSYTNPCSPPPHTDRTSSPRTSSMSDKDSFVLVQVNHQNAGSGSIMFHHAHLAQSVLSNGSGSQEGSCHNHSVDGWSEISCPLSHRSMLSKQASCDLEGSTEGTTGWHHIRCNGSGSIENQSITSNGSRPIFSSNSTTKEVDQCITNAEANASSTSMPPDPPQHHNDSNTIGSVGSRVPFSWAEITKIQPKFHNECAAEDIDHQRPKVFERTPRIETRHLPQTRSSNNSANSKPAHKAKAQTPETEIPMPSIPESDPLANKSDLGRRVRKTGKRGSRLKYPNGRRGGHRNRRKKNSK